MVRKKLEIKAFIDGALDVICSSYQGKKEMDKEQIRLTGNVNN